MVFCIVYLMQKPLILWICISRFYGLPSLLVNDLVLAETHDFRGVLILGSTEEIQQVLDKQMNDTTAMRGSAFVKPIKGAKILISIIIFNMPTACTREFGSRHSSRYSKLQKIRDPITKFHFFLFSNLFRQRRYSFFRFQFKIDTSISKILLENLYDWEPSINL